MERDRRARGSATRSRIVEAAQRLFNARGYEQTSLQAIADAVGVQKANVYYYFKTKAEILDAAMFGALDRAREVLATAAATPRGPARVQVLLDGYVDLLVANRHRKPWVALEPLTSSQRLARSVVDQLVDRATSLVLDGPPTLEQQLLISQLLSLQAAVPRLTGAGDDELRELLHRACALLMELDDHSSGP